jgi:hypothetical protein
MPVNMAIGELPVVVCTCLEKALYVQISNNDDFSHMSSRSLGKPTGNDAAALEWSPYLFRPRQIINA